MKRVLHITSSLHRNGTEIFVMNSYRAINRTAFQFDFLINSPYSREDFDDEAMAMGAKIYRLPLRNRPIAYLREHIRFFRAHAGEYAAVHFSACSLTQLFPLFLAWVYGVPIRVVHAHSVRTQGWHNRLLHALKRWVIGRVATHYLACSAEAARYFYPLWVRNKCVVLKNGVDVARFRFQPEIRQAARSGLQVEGKFVIGTVSRFSVVKNHRFLIAVFAEYCRTHHDTVLLLVGTGELEQSLRQQVQEAGLQQRVIFAGQRQDVPQLLLAMDYFVFPSLYEGFPFSLVEAQTAGLPILASDSIPAEVDITGNVRFMSLKDPLNAWSEQLERPFVRRDVSEQVRAAGYSIQDTVHCLETIYASHSE